MKKLINIFAVLFISLAVITWIVFEIFFLKTESGISDFKMESINGRVIDTYIDTSDKYFYVIVLDTGEGIASYSSFYFSNNSNEIKKGDSVSKFPGSDRFTVY